MRRYLKGVASIRIFLPYLLRLGQTKWNVMGGSLDLLEDLSEVLMEPGGIRMGPTEGTHSATPKLWHSSSHETARGGVLFFFLLVWPVACGNCSSETIGPFAHSSQHLLCVCVCFPHTTRAKSEEPAGVGCQAHYLVDILCSTPVETLPNYRPYALLRGFESQ